MKTWEQMSTEEKLNYLKREIEALRTERLEPVVGRLDNRIDEVGRDILRRLSEIDRRVTALEQACAGNVHHSPPKPRLAPKKDRGTRGARSRRRPAHSGG